MYVGLFLQRERVMGNNLHDFLRRCPVFAKKSTYPLRKKTRSYYDSTARKSGYTSYEATHATSSDPCGLLGPLKKITTLSSQSAW